MSKHAYSRCWIHLLWATLDREKLLLNRDARIKLSEYLTEYSQSKDIYMKINYVNPEHVHTLIDQPTKYSLEQIAQLFKGSSSHWINENKLIPGKFAWGRGYGAFSVSHSNVAEVAAYIAGQEEHHRERSFMEEYRMFVQRYGLEWKEEGRNR